MKTIPEILKLVNKYIIGQETAKNQLALAVFMQQYRHYTLVKNGFDYAGPLLPLPIIFLSGPSGSGKTFCASTFVKVLNVPSIVVDCTLISPQGWAGTSVSNCFFSLKQQIDDKLKNLKGGEDYNSIDGAYARTIVILDEFDKLLLPTDTLEQAYHKEKLYTWLNIISGTNVHVATSKTDSAEVVPTHNMLFVLCGSFEHSRDLLTPKRSIGFESKEPKINPISKDFLKTLHCPKELLGRITTIIELDSIDKVLIKRMLLHETGMIEEFRKLAMTFGYTLVVTPEEVDMLVNNIYNNPYGLRAAFIECFDLFKLRLLNIENLNNKDMMVYL